MENRQYEVLQLVDDEAATAVVRKQLGDAHAVVDSQHKQQVVHHLDHLTVRLLVLCVKHIFHTDRTAQLHARLEPERLQVARHVELESLRPHRRENALLSASAADCWRRRSRSPSTAMCLASDGASRTTARERVRSGESAPSKSAAPPPSAHSPSCRPPIPHRSPTAPLGTLGSRRRCDSRRPPDHAACSRRSG